MKFWKFEFVSDLDIRISDLSASSAFRIRRFKPWFLVSSVKWAVPTLPLSVLLQQWDEFMEVGDIMVCL